MYLTCKKEFLQTEPNFFLPLSPTLCARWNYWRLEE